MDAPDEMSIDIPASDGTLLHLTMRRDEAGRFSEKSEVEIQGHTPGGLRPLTSFRAGDFAKASGWIPGGRGGLMLSDPMPNIRIESHWLGTLTDWTLMAADTDIDIWRPRP